MAVVDRRRFLPSLICHPVSACLDPGVATRVWQMLVAMAFDIIPGPERCSGKRAVTSSDSTTEKNLDAGWGGILRQSGGLP